MKKNAIILIILSSCLSLTAQTGTFVNGVVLDAVNGTPMPYVSIFFEGTSHGDLTNSGGKFTIATTKDVISERSLKVMFSRYHTQELQLDADSLYTLKIHLMPVEYDDDIDVLRAIRIMGDEGRNPLPYYLYETVNAVLNDNLPLGNPKINKFDLYQLQEIPAYNHLEGIRLRLSLATNARLHPHLFAKGYVGYGFKDRKFKYRGELAWSFDKKAYHDDEFPRNSIRLIYENDIFSPGGNHPRLPNDFLMYSYRRTRGAMTYREFTEINYEKETLYGLSYQLWARMSEMQSACEMAFTAVDINRYREPMSKLKSKNAGISLRYFHNEAYIQDKRNRKAFSLTEPLFMLSHTVGENSVFGGDQLYQKTELSFQKRFSLEDYGFLDLVADYQKVWTKAPFPMLLYPDANRGYIVDNKSFYLVNAMDFINDEQYSIRLAYFADNLLFARIPILDALGFRELFILRGFHGSLSNRNIPTKENGLFVFPANTASMGNTPYIEGAVGITNILGLLRVEYVHRLTYRDHPNAINFGFRLDVTF